MTEFSSRNGDRTAIRIPGPDQSAICLQASLVVSALDEGQRIRVGTPGGRPSIAGTCSSITELLVSLISTVFRQFCDNEKTTSAPMASRVARS